MRLFPIEDESDKAVRPQTASPTGSASSRNPLGTFRLFDGIDSQCDCMQLDSIGSYPYTTWGRINPNVATAIVDFLFYFSVPVEASQGQQSENKECKFISSIPLDYLNVYAQYHCMYILVAFQQ